MSVKKAQSIVLLSGGLDSVVSLACACEECDVLFAVTFHYGQKAARMEIEAARECCKHFHIPHRILHLNWMRSYAKSSLLDDSLEIPQVSMTHIEAASDKPSEATRLVWVPNRNGLFVNVAAVLAESMGASIIVTGFNVEEGRSFPDNGPDFVAAVNRSLEFSTLNAVRVISFTQHLVKTEIVRLGMEKGAPVRLVYSCYAGGDLMCGHCESCQRLKRAFITTGNWKVIQDRFLPETCDVMIEE